MIDTEKGKAEVARFAIDVAIRLALIAAVVYTSMLLLQPVAPLLLWAIILAVAVYPLFLLMRQRLHLGNGLAAALMSLVLLVLLVTPVVILAASAIESLDDYARMLMKGGHIVPPPPESVRDWPMIGQRAYEFWLTASNDLKALLAAHVGQIASLGRFVGRIAAGVFVEVLQFAGAIIVAGILLAYAETLTESVRGLAGRIASSRGRHFLEITGSTIRNVSQGVIGIALLQSALLGVGMLVAGVPFAGAITFACLVLAIVQVGPNVVMIPVIIWAWMYLPALHAGLFTVYTAPLLLVDNVLRPIVMARGLQTPMAVILAGVICGTLAGGLIGLFVGPVILAVFYDLVVAWVANGQQPQPDTTPDKIEV
ncbi:MAG: AI-2E family transporter [Reyranella sp.]|jgi:predicted PurR-regulated permease PerM|nr:MAG: AI-2E family transporter [Reyranella sp.]